MSERGVFAVDRGIWSHDLFVSKDPFTRREAWLWIISEAAWKPHRRRIAGRAFDLGRGQLAASLRFMAERWRWSEPRVRRFLACLISDGMIDAKTDAGMTVITVCKYDEYQRVSLPSDASRNCGNDAAATQQRRKVEDKEDKEDKVREKKDDGAHAPSLALVGGEDAHDDYPKDAFDQFWKRYPHKVGKKYALKAFAAAKRTGVTWVRLMFALDRYINEKPPDRAWCNPATWLNQGRWDDEPATNTTGRSFGTGNRNSGRTEAIFAGVAESFGLGLGDDRHAGRQEETFSVRHELDLSPTRRSTG